MMSFCKNSLHAFLCSISNRDIPSSSSSSSPSPPPGLNSISADRRKPPNILESTSLKPPTAVLKKDPNGTTTTSGGGGSGCLDEIGSGGSMIHGLSSCTESLGFESSEQMEQNINENSIISKKSSVSASSKSKERSRFKEDLHKKFPPVLSSLRQNDGKRHSTSMSFLKPVRENGRLLLTKVTINKPEVFHSSRQDGRLRLQLIHQNSQSQSSSKPEEEVKEVQQNKIISSGTGAGEGLTRCHELVNRHREYHRRNNHLHLQQHQLWNQQCVTSQ